MLFYFSPPPDEKRRLDLGKTPLFKGRLTCVLVPFFIMFNEELTGKLKAHGLP